MGFIIFIRIILFYDITNLIYEYYFITIPYNKSIENVSSS